jgi:hypothetical protein
MMNHPLAITVSKTPHGLEVLHAVQTETRTSGWYWADVRGKAAVGAPTTALWRRDLTYILMGW